MLSMFVIILLGFLLIEAESYVLLQVRKQDNNFSNIDALIHKVVPSDKFEKIASKLARKDFKTKRLARNGDKDDRVNENKNNFEDIANSILDYAKKAPVFRSQRDGHSKPKIINFRSDKPSVVFEIDSKAVIKTIRNVLASDTFHTYMEKFAKQAAVVYRAIKEEMEKDSRE